MNDLKLTDVLPFYSIDQRSIHITDKNYFRLSPYQQLIFISSGEGSFIFEHGREVSITKGDMIFVHSGFVYAVHSLQDLTLDILLFDDTNAPLVCEYFHWKHVQFFSTGTSRYSLLILQAGGFHHADSGFPAALHFNDGAWSFFHEDARRQNLPLIAYDTARVGLYHL
ncbi:MAG: cupin domain-containing protein [Lachnospiraceae bacterium]